MTEKISSRLSVIISNYNHAHYLPEALQAMLSQSLRPMEVIIIDDGSTDNSVEIIEKFIFQDDMFRLFRNEKNMGVIFSMNRGLKLAVGEFVYFGAADDRICHDLFEKTLNVLGRYPEAGLCSALLQRIGPEGEDQGWIPTPVISSNASFIPPKEVIENLATYGSWFAGQTVIYRQKAITSATDGFLPELAHRTDHFVNYVVAIKHGACFIPEVLATYRILESGYAESVFDNEDLSRGTFSKLIELMQSSKYSNLFPNSLVKNLYERGSYDLEIRTLRRIRQSQIDFITRLKSLRLKHSGFDWLVFKLLRVLILLPYYLAITYLLHRRINWDLRYLFMKVKTRYDNYVPISCPRQCYCPLCGGRAKTLFNAQDENCRISETQYEYSKCANCQGVFLVNPPTDIRRYYRSNYYAIPTLDQLQKVASKDRNKIEIVLRFKRGGRLLEVGPAFGVFAWQAKKEGFIVDVIEMDANCCEFLQSTLCVNVTKSDKPTEVMGELPRHDVIAMWHVLEHLPDALSFLRAATNNLNESGVLLIAMPNPKAWQFKLMGRHWPHLDAPRHISLIPETWLTRQAEELGLEKVYMTSNDSDAQSWNRFGWQRLLMNRFNSKFMKRVMFVIGYVLSIIMAHQDCKNFNGSAYTIVFRKKSSLL